MTEETPPHFRYVVGRDFKITKKEVGISISAPVTVPG